MNNFQLRAFIRQVITEAKTKKTDNKAKTKKEESKKSIKKEEKAPKSSGKLVDLKKELAALKQYKEELMAAKFAEQTASTEVEFADLAKFAKELNSLKEKGMALEKQIDDKIKELETRISDEKNKIKEMMGLSTEEKKDKIVDEAKPIKKDPYGEDPNLDIKANPDVPLQGMTESHSQKGKKSKEVFKKTTK